MKNRSQFQLLRHTWLRPFVALLIATMLLQPPSARAADTPENVENLCGSTLANAKNAQEKDNQKLTQCQAAKASEAAYRTNDVLWKVWAGIATYCFAACGAALGLSIPVFVNDACSAASLAGGITDGVMTQEYTSMITNSIMTVMMAGGTKFMQKSGEDAAKVAYKDKKATKTDAAGSCMMAVTATTFAVTKSMAANNGKIATKTTLESVAKFTDNQAKIENLSMGSSGSGSTGTGSSITHSAAPKSGQGGGASQQLSNDCANAAEGGNGGAVFNCAQSSAANGLPGFISDPRFEKSFRDSTGTHFKDFLGNARTPASSISAAMSRNLSPSQASAMDQVLQKIEADGSASANSGALAASSLHSEATYTGGGAGSQGGPTGEAEPDLMAMMAGIMAQFGPKEPGGANQNDGVMSVVFAHQQQAAATIAENKTLNIFDRITYRYYFIIKKNAL